MSRKNYIAIAEVFRRLKNSNPEFSEIVEGIANMLKDENPRFDYDKFWDYINR